MNASLFGKKILFVSTLMVIASVCHGQTTTATATGDITDTQGAVVPGASVSMINLNTGIVSKTVTNNQGVYRISGLEPGVYKADISKQGFKSVIKGDIQLYAEQVAAMSFTLEVGSVSQSVIVTAGAPLVDTQSTSLGETLEGRAVEEAPLNGRNPMNLVPLVPGVVAEGMSQGNPASNGGSNTSQYIAFGNYQIGGGFGGWNTVYLDGAPENYAASPSVAIDPTQDSVSEFRVDSSAVSPQYGGFAGGVITFSTKSGGNVFHGAAYEYLRNTVLDANTFFDDRVDAPVPVLNQNQFGADLGGPIIRDNSFFFFSWETTRLMTAAAQQFRVPTPAEMSGNFTADYGTTTDGIQDYANLINGVPQPPEDCPGGSINIICPQHLSPTTAEMYKLQYFTPVESNPTVLAKLKTQGYNSEIFSHQPNNENQYVGRIDHKLTDKQELFLRYTWWNVYIPLANIVKSPAVPTNPYFFTSQQYVAGDNYTISPTLYASLRLAYSRFQFRQDSNGNGNFDLSQFGPLWAAVGAQTPYKDPPSLWPCNTWANEAMSLNDPIHDNYNNYSASIGVTKVAGHHSIMFGGEAQRIEAYDYAPFWPDGNFVFNQGGMPQFVVGVSNYQGGLSVLQVTAPTDDYAYYQGYYVTDTYQLRPKLTLNLGVRWELPGAWLEKHDHNSVLLANKANPLGTFANPVSGGPTTLMGEVVEVNSPAYPSRTQSEVHHRLFDPRLGVNYSIDSSTVIRAGFGISHPCIACGSTLPDSSPLNTATTLNPSGFSSIDNPYPDGVLEPLERSTQIMQPYSQFKQTLIGASVSGEQPYEPYSYVEQWNLNLERSFGSSVTAMVGYSGSSGFHLAAASPNLDQLSDQYDSLGNQLLTQVPNPFQGIAQPSGNVGGATANYGQFLVPYPEFSGVTSSGEYYGQSSYNALVASLRKRLSAGATINASYTWAHFITNEEGALTQFDPGGIPSSQDYTNLRADRSNSAADIPQTLTVNYIYDLPFGKRQRYLAQTNALLDHIVSGWELSGISTFQSGFPLFITVQGGNALSNNFYAGAIRPNVVPGVSKKMPGRGYDRLNAWFNTAAFTSPGNFAFGNESRVDSTLRAAGIDDWDMALSKTTAIKEGVSIQFNAEYFNAFNHPQFGAPNTSLGNPNFGVVTGQTSNGATDVNQPRIGQMSLRVTF